MILSRFVLVLVVILTPLSPIAVSGEEPVLSRIAFGACARQDRPQPIWDAVVEAQPQLFLFLGDNIYGDSEDMNVLKEKYNQLANQPGYQKLKQNCRVLGTWDDHDYGVNDGGVEYAKKRESQQIFLDFFEVPKDDIRRVREGVYSSSISGPAGKRVQIILLDGRYFRSPLKTGFQAREPGEGYRGKYAPNSDSDATMLGKAQWQWLEEQLRMPAELRIVCSGIQVIPDEHGSEIWGNFPLEREKLFRTIRDTHASGVVFLSGDRHLSELSRLPADHPLGVGYPLYDLTSTSLNVPSGNLTKSGVRFANEINSYRIGLTYFDTNFGCVLIDWEQADPVIRLQIREEKGQVVLQQRISLSQLQMKLK